jgi:nucleotide-binding universal stress UspA family protein
MKSKPRNRKKGKTPRRIASALTSGSAPRKRPIKLRTILVTTDFSKAAEKGIEYAVPFARHFGAKLILLHVVEPITPADFATFPLVMENEKFLRECKHQLEKLAKRLLDPAEIDRTLVRYGAPFYEITEAARTLKADLVIIATRGSTGLKRVLLGSTAEKVVRHAPCPVLVIRQKDQKLIRQAKQ